MARTINPIRPDEVITKRKDGIPDFVIEAFNELIAKEYNGQTAVIRQDDVVRLLEDRGVVDRSELYNKHWLDVEDLYRAAGWKVEYDKPAYNETYPAYFTFTRKSKRP